MNDDERIAYLAGDTGARVDPAERAELDRLRGLLADPAVWAEPEVDLQERIVGVIAGAAAQSSDAARDLETMRPPADVGNVVRMRRPWARYALLGAAAAVLVAVGLTIGLTNRGSTPVTFAATLQGSALAPDASGQVTMTKTTSGWRIHLQAEGLPRLDNGAYYQAWLKNDAGILVSIGTFNQPDDVTLWSGVPPSSHPTLTVTRELADGDPASSGQVVLEGTTHPEK